MIDVKLYKSHLRGRLDEVSEKIFQGALRLYYPIDLGDTLIDNTTYLDVCEFIEDEGGEVIDYIKGTFKDEYGRVCKIGKYLTKSKEDDLLKKFINDSYRTIKNEKTTKKYKVCISRHINDVCYMTTNRRWEDKSCMVLDDRKSTFCEELEKQTLIAYLIDEDDLEIGNPYSRILIKRHFLMGDESTWIYYPSPVIYGIVNEGFRKFIFDWLDGFQKNIKNGVYSLHSELEGVGYPLIHAFDKVTRENIAYIIDKLDIFQIVNGYYEIDDNLEISVFSKKEKVEFLPSPYKSGSVILTDIYNKLPFKFKSVEGDFVISDNYLTTLENCPEFVGGDFVCSSIRISSLKYCPTTVGGIFDCSHNSKISSLNYLPETLNVLDAQCCYVKTLKGNSTLKKVNEINLYNNELVNLEGFPSVSKTINVGNNKLTSIEGIPNKRFYDFDISYNSKLKEKYTEVQIRELYKIRGILNFKDLEY